MKLQLPRDKAHLNFERLFDFIYLIWGIGACTLAPGGPREAQWGYHRVFSAGSKMNCSTSFIEISSEKSSRGTPRIRPFMRYAHEV